MFSAEEYLKTYVRMMDSLRAESFRGEFTCAGVDCEVCPLCKICGTTELSEAIKIVKDWGKTHPLVTMKEKYEEEFGVEPSNYNGNYICPQMLGFYKRKKCKKGMCSSCARAFWNSEYRKVKE